MQNILNILKLIRKFVMKHKLYANLHALVVSMVLTVLLMQAGSLFLFDYIPDHLSVIHRAYQDQSTWKLGVNQLESNFYRKEEVFNRLNESQSEFEDVLYSWAKNQKDTKLDVAYKKLLSARKDFANARVHGDAKEILIDKGQGVIKAYDDFVSASSPLTNDYESQFNYHLIIDRLEEIVFQLSAEGKIIFLNPAWESLLELKVKGCLNKSLLDFFHPEDRPMLEARLNSLTQGKRPNCTLEARLLSVHGSPNWIVMRAKTTSTSAGERTSVIGTMTNIQNNKEAEASVLASRRASNSLLSHIPALVYRGRNDRFWTFEYVSDGCIDLTGYDPQDFLNGNNLNFNLIIHPDDRANVWESVNQQLGLSEKFKLIYRIVTRKGETKLVQEYGRGIFSSTGELLALEGFITEIPEQQYRVKSLLH